MHGKTTIKKVFGALRTETVQNVPVWDATSVLPHEIIREPLNGCLWELVLKTSFRDWHIVRLISDNFCSHRHRSKIFTAADKRSCHCIARADALGWGTEPEAGRTRVRFPRVSLREGERVGALGWGTAPEVGRSRVRFPMMSKEHTFDSFWLSKQLSKKRRRFRIIEKSWLWSKELWDAQSDTDEYSSFPEYDAVYNDKILPIWPRSLPVVIFRN
jgi:hypothetical protein